MTRKPLKLWNVYRVESTRPLVISHAGTVRAASGPSALLALFERERIGTNAESRQYFARPVGNDEYAERSK
jgi:hypothetical protein